MALFQIAWSTFILAARRIWSQINLMICLLIGLIAAVGLLSSIPMYSDAINNKLLQGELTDQGSRLPPFALTWRYIGAWNGDIDEEAYTPVNQYLTDQAELTIGLPLDFQVRHERTAKLRLFPDENSQTFVSNEPLLFTSIGFVTGLSEKVQFLEGNIENSPSAEFAPVIISSTLADQVGIQVGERYVAFAQGSSGEQIPVEIVGVWVPNNPSDPFWFYPPGSFDEVLLTTEAAFTNIVMPEIELPISQAVWYQLYDGSRVRTNDVANLLEGIRSAESRVDALLSDTTLDTSPVSALETYGDSARLLTVLLTIFAIPVAGLVFYFISLIAGMVVRRGQNEIAVLRSRGTTRAQIIAIFLLEGLIIAALGLAGGLVLGRFLAQVMSQTQSFLNVALRDEPLPILLSPTAWQYAIIALVISILALLLPAFFTSRFTIVVFKAERARALEKPIWQRYFIDVLLLVPPIYGWYLLSQQGTISALNQGDDLFTNPLLFLVPALFCFSISLIFIRFFPLLVGVLAWFANKFASVSGLLTLRQLSRAATQYTGPLLLISLTLSLATFTASMALTLDEHLVDQVYYQTGADLNLAELGENTEEPDQATLPGQQQPEETEEDENEPRFLFLPVTEHLTVDGVEAAARVGDYTATSNIGGRQQTGRLLGVDRIDFPDVAFFRKDFTVNDTLGGMMNRLAASRDNILVSQDFLTRRNLAIGDPLRLNIGAAGDFEDVEFVVSGIIDLFPTYFPEDGPLFVANLDYVHEGLGGQYPYNVWLEIDESAEGDAITSAVRNLGIVVVTADDAKEIILEEQLRPERQGVFGLLSVGFFAAAGLTVLGFLIYAVVSFQRRFIELGMLRAIGLSVGQMVSYLATEQAILILTGMGLGTVIGVFASQLFIPFLQIGLSNSAQVPPFIVQIAWDQLLTIYAVFGAMFVIAVLILVVLLVRMRIFEAVKLGETI